MYLAAYEASLGMWPIPYASRVIDTPFGATHVIDSGAADGPPLVLLHAASLSATQWAPQAFDLGVRHRLCAVDIMGDIGRSTQRRPIHSRADAAEWLAAVLDGLDVSRAILVGSSFGGFLATNLAVLDRPRVAGLVLLAPAATVQPFRLAANVVIRAGSLLPMPFTVKPGLRGMMEGELPDDRIVSQMEAGVRGFRYDRAGIYPSELPDTDLRSIDIPTLLLVGDRERIYDPEMAVSRARRLMRDVDARVIPGVGHLLGMQRPDVVDPLILGWLDRVTVSPRPVS